MRYVEMPIEEAIKKCKKNAKILVATQDLANSSTDAFFILKRGSDCIDIFKDVKTVASLSDDLVEQLKLFTEKQDIHNILPYGLQRIVILRE